jgi:hypothetical protein
MELFFFKRLRAFFDDGWVIRFTGKYDLYPAVEYKCPFCQRQLSWVASNVNGFNGKPPVINCCPNAVPYPVGNPEYLAHLMARPKWDNKRESRSPFVDNWDELPSGYRYTGTGNKGSW